MESRTAWPCSPPIPPGACVLDVVSAPCATEASPVGPILPRTAPPRPHCRRDQDGAVEGVAWVGGRVFIDLVDATSDLDALDSPGPWIVVLPFSGSPLCA